MLINLRVLSRTMTKHVLIDLDDEEHERYRRAKDWHGLTWAEVLMRGIETLDVPGEPSSEE